MPQQIRLTRERFLPLSKDTLVSWLVESLRNEDEKNQFYRLCSSIEALFHAQRLSQIEDIKQCYATFDRLNPLFDEAIVENNVEELQKRQNRLLENIFQILNASNFTPVTYENYANALKSVYLSDLPIAVDWAKLDSTMFKNFFENHPQMYPYGHGQKPPPFYNHFALFYCGVGSIIKEDLYFDHKINLLSTRIQTYLKRQFYHLLSCIQGRLYTQETTAQVKAAPIDVKNPMENWPSEEQGSRYIQRISLADTFAEAEKQGWKAVIWWFLAPVQLQEPTFRRLVLVYRSLPEGMLAEKLRRAREDSKKLSRKMKEKFHLKQESESNVGHIEAHLDGGNVEAHLDVVEKTAPGTLEENKQINNPQVYNEFKRLQSVTKFQEPPSHNNVKQNAKFHEPINVRYFADVPMADLEVVFPCKRLSLKTFDRIYLIVVIVMGLYYIVQEFFAEHESKWWHYATVIAAAALVIRAVTWYRTQESLYHAALTETLSDAAIASDSSVLLSLVDACNTQDLLETMIAYHALLQDRSKGYLKTTEDVDRYCERLLREKLGTEVDFEINDAIRKLKLLGLVEEKIDINNNNNQLLTVKPLDEGIDCVHRQWLSFTSSFRSIKNVEKPKIQTTIVEM